jgi:hypothetical protein
VPADRQNRLYFGIESPQDSGHNSNSKRVQISPLAVIPVQKTPKTLRAYSSAQQQFQAENGPLSTGFTGERQCIFRQNPDSAHMLRKTINWYLRSLILLEQSLLSSVEQTDPPLWSIYSTKPYNSHD